jgi:hypothetical protein
MLILEALLNVLIVGSGLTVILWNAFNSPTLKFNYVVGAGLVKTGVANLIHLVNFGQVRHVTGNSGDSNLTL